MRNSRDPISNDTQSTKAGMTEWQGLLLGVGIVLSMLIILALCLLLPGCSCRDTCVFDEWYDSVRRLERHGRDDRLSQMEGAWLDYDFGIEFVGVYVGERDEPRFGLCYWGDIDMLVVYCFDHDETYTYDPDTNTLTGTSGDSSPLDELMQLYFDAASIEKNQSSRFIADDPGSWTFAHSDNPTLEAFSAQHTVTEND